MGIDATMFVRVSPPLPPEEIERIRFEMCEAFGHDKFMQWRHDEPMGSFGGERRALYVVDKWEQDGPDIEPLPGEQFIEVSLGGRYWGPGYERGDFPFLYVLSLWLEKRFGGGATVWYGGDSSGVEAECFGDGLRREFLDHFVRVGNRPYRGDALSGAVDRMAQFNKDNPGLAASFSKDKPPATEPETPICDFCKVPLVRFGWGGTGDKVYGSYSCAGCGKQLETRDSGKTWHKPKDRE